MPIEFVQSKTVQTVSATSVTTPSMISTAGNFLVAAGAQGFHDISGTPMTDNKSNTWTNAFIRNTSTGRGALYFAQNILGGTGHTFTFTYGAGTDSIALAVLEFSGIRTVGALDQVAHSAGGAAPHVSGNVTTTDDPYQLLIGMGSDSNGQCIPPASAPGMFTDVVALPDGAAEGILLSYAIVDEMGTYYFEYTYESGFNDSEPCGIATFKGAGISYVQSKSAQSAAATTLTTPAMTSTSGNFLVAVVDSSNRTFSGSPVSDSKSNVWASAWATARAGCYYVPNIVGGASHTVTVTPPGGSSACAIAVAEFSGVNAVSPFDRAAFASTTTEPRSSGLTAATRQAEELLIGGAAANHITNIPYSTINGDFTDAVALRSIINGVEGIIVSYRIVQELGTYSYGFSNGHEDQDAVGIATFKAAPPPMPQATDNNWQLHRFDLKPRIEETA